MRSDMKPYGRERNDVTGGAMMSFTLSFSFFPTGATNPPARIENFPCFQERMEQPCEALVDDPFKQKISKVNLFSRAIRVRAFFPGATAMKLCRGDTSADISVVTGRKFPCVTAS